VLAALAVLILPELLVEILCFLPQLLLAVVEAVTAMALMAGLAAAVDTTHLVVQATLQALLQAKVTMEVMVLAHQPMQVVVAVVLVQ
jgi:hypothetical protein